MRNDGAPPRIRNLAGRRFGRLEVLQLTAERRRESAVWLCRCDCGREHRIAASQLTGGRRLPVCDCAIPDVSAPPSIRDSEVFGRIDALISAGLENQPQWVIRGGRVVPISERRAA